MIECPECKAGHLIVAIYGWRYARRIGDDIVASEIMDGCRCDEEDEVFHCDSCDVTFGYDELKEVVDNDQVCV